MPQVITMISGFATFGAVSDSFILNSYSVKDPLAVVARCAAGISQGPGIMFMQ